MTVRGGIAQLGERDAGSVEVRGSSPLTSTKSRDDRSGTCRATFRRFNGPSDVGHWAQERGGLLECLARRGSKEDCPL